MPQIEDLSPESEEEIDLTTPKRKSSKKKKGSPYMTTKGYPKGKKPVDTRGKTARDFWIDGMRNGTGYLTTQSSPTIKRPKSAGKTFDGSRTLGDYDGMQNGRTPRSARTPGTYKPAEDLYDDIIDLKRQLNGIKEENSILSTRNRRLEEENVKKQKQVEQLLDPGKSEDLRRAMNERKPDAGAVVNSLKQKNLKLEQTLRDKEIQLSKLQSDLKSTKLDELKVENDMYYQEIIRLRNAASSGVRQESRKSEHASAPSAAKVKALNATILRLTESNQRLQSENKLLKQDLDSAMEGSMSSPRSASKNARQRKKGKFDYEDMNKRELLRTIAELEKEVEKYESGSILDARSTRSGPQVEGKVVLSGGLAERVEALDKRETELLEEKKKNSEQISRLKEDRMKFRVQVDEKEEEIKKLMKEIARLETELSERAAREERVPTPRKRPSSASSLSSSERRRAEEEERYRRAEELREKNSAKRIQKNWKKHKQRKQQDEEDLDDAAVLIQSSMRGHFKRKEQLQKSDQYHRYSSSVSGRSTPRSSRVHTPISELDDESGLDDAATTIQSAMRGHWNRKEQMSRHNPRFPPPEESDSDSHIRSKSYSGKFQKTSQSGFGRSTISSQYSDDDDSDDDLIVSTPTRAKTSTSYMSGRNRPSSARSYGSKSGRESPIRGEFGTSSRISKVTVEESEEDSDDDIIVASSSSRLKSSGKLF